MLLTQGTLQYKIDERKIETILSGGSGMAWANFMKEHGKCKMVKGIMEQMGKFAALHDLKG